jgi:acyl-CoA thioesterase
LKGRAQLAVINSGIDEKLFVLLRDSIGKTPFYNLLNLHLNELGPGFAEIGTTTRPEHTNPLGIIHGGLPMSMADAAMANAVRSLGVKAVTVDCSTSFTAAAGINEALVARGKVLKSGKNLIFVEASVFCGDKLIADSKGTFYKMGVIDF